MHENALETPLPAGLRELTAAQTALAEFLMLDPDWLAAAAQDSAPLAGTTEEAADYDVWLAMLEPSAMRSTLRLLLEGRGQEAERGLPSYMPEPTPRGTLSIKTCSAVQALLTIRHWKK